jgi:predicted dehydrogenase
MINERKMSWGIAGLGQIAERFAQDLVHHSKNGELCAVASRSGEQAKLFAEQFSCQKHYGSYLDLALDPDIEVVYVSTINPFHKSLAKLFLENGKHVLVEKPAFINTSDWDEMVMLAKKNDLLLIEAMKTVTFPGYQKLLAFLMENKIQLHSIEAAFGFYSQLTEYNRLFDKQLSGGATLDVGVYPLWLYCDLVTSLGGTLLHPSIKINSGQYNVGVDEYVEFLFDGPIKGKLRASITQDLDRTAILRGPGIEIVIADKWWNPQSIKVVWQGNAFVIDEPIEGGGFQFEAQHMADLILQGQKGSTIIRSEVSRSVIAIMENALRSNQFGHLVR